MNWYYASGGQQLGPVDEAKLQELVQTGVVNSETLVWREGLDGWKPYSTTVSGAPPSMRYAGFWIRFLAHIIDSIIMIIIMIVVGCILVIPFGFMLGGAGITLGDNPTPAEAMAVLPAFFGLFGILALIVVGISVFYQAYFLSKKGATPGKMALGLKVIRADGGPVSAGLAVGRYFASMLSGSTLWIGYIIAGFDAEKRSLHDHICSTRVIRTS